jgi:hypothetical protein
MAEIRIDGRLDRGLTDLSEEVYWTVFQLLDSQPEMDGMTAGKIATACQQAFDRLAVQS